MTRRALVLCPGRGSYGRTELGTLQGRPSAFLDAFDAHRASLGRPTVRELDAAERYSAKLHIAGEHASILTAGYALSDVEAIDPARLDVVGICGNSMGWYTALVAAGAACCCSCCTRRNRRMCSVTPGSAGGPASCSSVIVAARSSTI